MPGYSSMDQLFGALAQQRYLVDEGLGTVVYLALKLRRPLLLEGEPGVGKTELAKALAAATGTPLIRLQCYEGIDVHHALYDWDYPRQLLQLRAGGTTQLYSSEFLLRRPLLEALSRPNAVLLIDELDRADDEFEAFLLEFLAEFQVTIPEVGVIKADEPPVVIITSNRTRDLHEALKRRCLYHWIEHPDLQRELAIVRARLPHIGENLAHQVCSFVQDLRWLDLYRSPGVGETLDWLEGFHALGRNSLDPATADRTLGVLLKERDDLDRIRSQGLEGLIARSQGAGQIAGRLPMSTTHNGQQQRTAEDAALYAAVEFARALRTEGLCTSVDNENVFLRALNEIDIRDPMAVFWAGHADVRAGSGPDRDVQDLLRALLGGPAADPVRARLGARRERPAHGRRASRRRGVAAVRRRGQGEDRARRREVSRPSGPSDGRRRGRDEQPAGRRARGVERPGGSDRGRGDGLRPGRALGAAHARRGDQEGGPGAQFATPQVVERRQPLRRPRDDSRLDGDRWRGHQPRPTAPCAACRAGCCSSATCRARWSATRASCCRR